jgi:uncharacterized protein
MSLKEKISSDTKAALKAGDSFKAGVLRMLTSAISNKEIENRGKSADFQGLSDEDVEKILITEAKKRKEAESAFMTGGRTELAIQEKKELGIIEKYLPEQISEDQLREIIDRIFETKNPGNIGEAMKMAMAELRGRADGAKISQLVKDKIGK